MTSPLSFSRVSTFLDCGEKFRLRYVEGIKETVPAWWSIAGSAIHSATEEYDRYNGTDPKHLFDAAFDQQIEKARNFTEAPMDEWRFNSKGEDGAFWQDKGPAHVANYIKWREQTQWPVLWIELRVEGTLAGQPYIGYIDRIFVNDDGQPIIVDIKSGSSTPYLPLQQGLYRELLLQSQGIAADLGAFFKTAPARGRDGGLLTEPVDLTKYAPLLEAYTTNLATSQEQGLYVPKPSYFCGSCDVRMFCSAADILPSPTPKRKKTTLRVINTKKEETA